MLLLAGARQNGLTTEFSECEEKSPCKSERLTEHFAAIFVLSLYHSDGLADTERSFASACIYSSIPTPIAGTALHHSRTRPSARK